MRAWAIIPVKRFGGAKTRLARALGPDQRHGLAAAMAADVLSAVSRVGSIDGVICVSGEPEVQRLAFDVGAELVADPDDTGHSQAAALGLGLLAERGIECAALLSADCPLIDSAEIEAVLSGVGPDEVTVISDRHQQGSNGLILSPPDAIDPAFGPGSRKRHLLAASAAGMRARAESIPSMLLDLDTPDDLELLRTELGAGRGRAPLTAAYLARGGGS